VAVRFRKGRPTSPPPEPGHVRTAVTTTEERTHQEDTREQIKERARGIPSTFPPPDAMTFGTGRNG